MDEDLRSDDGNNKRDELLTSLQYMPVVYDSANLRFIDNVAVDDAAAASGDEKRKRKVSFCGECRRKASPKKRAKMRANRQQQREATSQISDDESCHGSGGICSSCRLAVNKDTGRLKWCMGGNDRWRTRIRFMLLIPAVILPVAILIIALSKSQLIGKLAMRSTSDVASGTPEAELSDGARLDHRMFIPTAHNDVQESGVSSRQLHPDIETSFVPTDSLLTMQAHHLQRRRRRRDASQQQQQQQQQRRAAPAEIGEAESTSLKKQRRSSSEKGSSSDDAGIKSGGAQELSSRQAKAAASKRDCDEASSSSSLDCDDDSDDVSIADSDEAEEPGSEEAKNSHRRRSEPFDVVIDAAVAAAIGLPEDRSYTVERDDVDFRAFWDGEWNEQLIRDTQAKLMSRYMDSSVNPCDDFYRYSCGNWAKYNPIPDDKAGLDTLETVRESLDLVLKRLLEEEPALRAEFRRDSAVAKAKRLFQSCMNNDILEKRLETPLLKLLDDLGGWPILNASWDPARFDWLLLVARLRLYSNDVLISEWVGPDIKNSDEYVIQFDQTTLGLPTKDYFLEASNKVYLTAYQNYLIAVATLLGAHEEVARLQADEIVQFEIQLANVRIAFIASKLKMMCDNAQITLSPNERRNSSDLYRRLSLEQLHATIPQIDWRRYLSIVLGRPAKYSEPVVMFARGYLQQLVKLLSRTPARTVANYLLWRFVRHRVNSLDDRFQAAKQSFYSVYLGRRKSPQRWKSCVAQVNWNMGMAVGSMFVRRYFDGKSKNDTLRMTREMQRSFRELLNHSSWLDEATKYLSSQKVEAMQLRIGYPDFILSEEDLDERYKDVHVHPDKYFENILNMLRQNTKVEHDKLGHPVNKTLWLSGPAMVNAYYKRNKNQITFPAGILQPPFYHRYFPRSLNYGGIGVVIGHEITHGFDNKGRMFDKRGNFQRWWSDDTVYEFEQRASCFVAQYNNYTMRDVSLRVNGLNTQGENIADNGGIKQAFRAYEKWLLENKSTRENLPGIDLTGKQLFFLNFAQIWCGQMRGEAMRHMLKTDLHSPGRYRVIGTLSNFDEFAKVFDCPLGSPMNPANKCLVW